MKRTVFLFALAIGVATVLPSISRAHDHHSSHGNPAYVNPGGHGYSNHGYSHHNYTGHGYTGSGQGYAGPANYGHGYQLQYAPIKSHSAPIHDDYRYGGHGYLVPSHVGQGYYPSNGYGGGF